MEQHKNLYTASIIGHYFPDLSCSQIALFNRLDTLYRDWNAKINLISRKDIDQLYLHHVLHSLAIAKLIAFCPDTKVLDFGTGGGFPGIPLAIIFPEAHFHLVDAIGKKIKVVQEIVTALGLFNVTVSYSRGEAVEGLYDFVVGRAVTNLALFYNWSKNKIVQEQKNSLPNGMLYLTGQPTAIPPLMQVYPLQDFFKDPFFQGKCVVHSGIKRVF